ncbi:hypothetical protein D3C80_2193220 [compost metagenome]
MWESKNTTIGYWTEHYKIEGYRVEAFTDHAGCGSFTFLHANGSDYSYLPEIEFDLSLVYGIMKRAALKDA